MIGALVTRLKGVPARIEEGAARQGLAYPWWIPVISALSPITLTVVALAQRDAWLSPRPVTLAVGLVVAPFAVELITERWVPWWMKTALLVGAVAWLLADAASVSPLLDMAPPVLAFLAAEVTATDGLRAGAVSTVGSILVIAAFGLDDRIIHMLEIMLGLVVGAMLRWQMRALIAERAARSGERERATLAERQRIAREVHDLVGHSLSVTLLHVTGARRALSEDDDVPEAIDALTEAERIGRQAMTDIRRTVHVLATEPEGTRPLPSAADVEALVEDVRAAGLRVDYRVSGDPDALSPAAGLGVYRIAQESLANVAKHAPSEPVDMSLDVDADRLHLHVRNRRPRPITDPSRDGTGLAGMASRAKQLGGTCEAGPDGDHWRVDLLVPTRPSPVGPEQRAHDCRIRKVLP